MVPRAAIASGLRTALAAALLTLAGAAQAGSLNFCDPQAEPSAAVQDKLLRFSALVKQELERSGARVALVARSGLDLERFGHRYSHAGLALRESANTPWSVRQLYYACDEKRPRIFDQGMSGFVMGTSDVDEGYVSLLILPPGSAAADALERAALDDQQALALLGADYSPNAYAFGLKYQNCNQWLAELLALAWGDAADRAGAQAWLRTAAYEPSAVHVGLWLLLMPFTPWVHGDDHPREDKALGVLQVSMPASLARFAEARVPGARRVELCHRGDRVVLRQNAVAQIAAGCVPQVGDQLLDLAMPR